ncbi:MAG: matrixin family metalloprotease [Gemmataceae bacterium]
MGAAYTLGTETGPNGTTVPTRWAQPGGRGTPVSITYSYSNLLDGRLGGGLTAAQIRSAVEEALRRWATYAPLRFIEVPDAGPAVSLTNYDATNKPMIRIGHRAMDGAMGSLGYTFYPGLTGLSGDVHVDTAEKWALNPSQGIDLIEVMVHELGHALGLAHPTTSPAIMSARYSASYRGPGTSFLHADDIAGIQALYGPGQGSVTPLTAQYVTGQTFRVVGNGLYVNGTESNDVLILDAGASPRVTLNGKAFEGNLAGIRTVAFMGRSGVDHAIIRGSSSAEAYTLIPQQLTMTGPKWNLSLKECEIFEVWGGEGDTVMMTGSAQVDRLTGRPGFVNMNSPGYIYVVREFGSVRAQGVGGMDLATLQGSAGDDTWTASPGASTLSGPGYTLRLEGYENSTLDGLGGNDLAKWTDSLGDDLFQFGPLTLSMASRVGTYSYSGISIEQVEVNSRGGQDRADLVGSTSNDVFVGTPTYSSLATPTTFIALSNFKNIKVQSGGGQDEAYLYDSAGNDQLTFNGVVATLLFPTASVQFSDYSYSALYGIAGGVNRRPASQLPFTVDWFGTWL